MNELLTKFKSLCLDNIQLPDSGPITVTQLNIQFQNELFNIIRNISQENNITIHYH